LEHPLIDPALGEDFFADLGEHPIPSQDIRDMIYDANVGCVTASSAVACYFPFPFNVHQTMLYRALPN